MKTKLIIIWIFLLAAFFRLYGVNWDQGQHLHPDERFLTMVSTDISWPKDLGEYLDTQISPLNPHNRGFGFFVYGTFPVFFTKWVAETLELGDYGNLTLVGRQLSAFVDLGTVIFVFLIAKELIPKSKTLISNKYQNKNNPKLKFGYLSFIRISDLGFRIFPLIAMFLYSIMVLPIQLSHFYAVETYLTFFITLSFYILTRLINCKLIGNWKLEIGNYAILLGIAFGLALASKITAILFLPVIGIGLVILLVKLRNFRLFFVLCSLFFFSTYLTFRLAQPYLFANSNIFDLTLNSKVLDNWKQLKSFDDASGGFPPAVQWITTKPYLFPLKNMLLWGLGLPLGIITLSAIGYELWVMGFRLILKKVNSQHKTYNLQLTLILIWILLLFIYQGGQFTKAMRYFHLIYPFLAIISGYFIIQILNKLKNHLLTSLLLLMLLSSLLIYPLSFISIYSIPHSRVTASEWIYQNIPPGSTLSGEHWDDYLPMSLPTHGYIREKYKSVEFTLYYPDNKDKWKTMETKLQSVDYIILSSNRLYGSIMTAPKKYPITAKYYKSLFDGSLGFEKIAEFTSRPNLPIPGIKICLTPPFVRYGIVALPSQECPQTGLSFVDDYADETFTIYDHPKVFIFRKIKSVDYLRVLGI